MASAGGIRPGVHESGAEPAVAGEGKQAFGETGGESAGGAQGVHGYEEFACVGEVGGESIEKIDVSSLVFLFYWNLESFFTHMIRLIIRTEFVGSGDDGRMGCGHLPR